MIVEAARLLVCAAAIAGGTAGAQPVEPRRAELLNKVKQDCGSCHGLTMKGGLGPALEPRAMAGKDEEQILQLKIAGAVT